MDETGQTAANVATDTAGAQMAETESGGQESAFAGLFANQAANTGTRGGEGQSAHDSPGAGSPENQSEGKDAVGSATDAADGEKPEGEDGDKAAFDGAAWEAFVDGLEMDSGLDRQALKDFGQLAGELNLNMDAAQKLYEWGQKNAESMQKARTAQEREALRAEWGKEYDRRIESATSVVAMLDRELGDNRFKKAIEKYGVCADADFARGLWHISRLLEEDSLGQAGNGAAAQSEESAYDGLKAFFK